MTCDERVRGHVKSRIATHGTPVSVCLSRCEPTTRLYRCTPHHRTSQATPGTLFVIIHDLRAKFSTSKDLAVCWRTFHVFQRSWLTRQIVYPEQAKHVSFRVSVWFADTGRIPSESHVAFITGLVRTAPHHVRKGWSGFLAVSHGGLSGLRVFVKTNQKLRLWYRNRLWWPVWIVVYYRR